MGRPLYSIASAQAATTTATTTPSSDVTIRAAPDAAPDHPEVRKWSYWNAFDPDADEFFDGPNAVYEAFVDHSPLPPLNEEDLAVDGGFAPRRVARARRVVEAEEELRPYLSPSTSRSSSPSSEGILSGRVSPATPLADTFVHEVHESPAVMTIPLSHQFEEADPGPEIEEVDSEEAPVIRRILTPPDVSAEEDAVRPATPPPRPVTPPNNVRNIATTTPLIYSPSPPPTVTPRLFTWAPRNIYPVSPLPNRSARMSGASLPPAYIPPAIVNRVHG